MRVIITGAAGEIGTQVVQELSNTYELCLMDRRPLPGQRTMIADLSKMHSWTLWKSWWRVARYSRWMEAFEGADVVVHLAVDQRPAVPEQQRLFNNMQMTLNVMEAAVRHHVSRIVFASSNWAVKALEQEMAPACYMPDGPKIGSEAQPRPIDAYGIGKAFGEIAGRMFVDQQKLTSFVAVRIGWYPPRPLPMNEEYRRQGITAEDLRGLFRSCVEAEFSGFHVVYGVSAQSSAPYNLSHTRELLCWQPQQQA